MPAWVREGEEAADLGLARGVVPEWVAAKGLAEDLVLAQAREVKDNEGLYSHHG
jgi:hypothetical protein